MVDQYCALAVQPSVWYNHKREDFKKNADQVHYVIERAIHLCSIEFPVKLIAIPEGAFQGFLDAMRDDHVWAARELWPEIPGEETDIVGEWAKQYNCYIIGHLRAKDTEFILPDRYFNMAFIVNPKGKIIHKYHKLQVFARDPSCTPHDVWDKWVELYGNNLDAFFPVADTEIGKIGTLVCMDGSFPETARGLTMNGAEILYRSTYTEPWVGNDWWEIQNRARALDNTCYVIAPNLGPSYTNPNIKVPIADGGDSMIVDYRGNIISRHRSSGTSYVSGIINLEALREFRAKALFGNFLKDLRTEVYKVIYKNPIYPKNLWLKDFPKKNPERDMILRQTIAKLLATGVYTPPENSNASD